MEQGIGKGSVQSTQFVRLAGIGKSYDGRTQVVSDLNLDIARGEFLTLLGPSGSGKTTTLMMLAGFETPTSGRIELDGNDITRVPPHRRGIGVVFQNYALFPHMSVEANIGYPLAVRGVAKSEVAERVAAALEIVKLGGLGARRPAQLSGGQQQRVALARALVFKPELVLLDEPLGALDKQLRERMQQELKQLHEMLGVTMVYVTHDQSEALAMSDRIAVFNEGRIQQLADPATIYERPATAFVAGFVGENNQLPGRVTGTAAASVIVSVAPGVEFHATARQDLAMHTKVCLAVRPERIKLGGDQAANRLPATIDRLVYLGDAVRVILSLGHGLELTAKLARDDLAEGMVRGSHVTVSCPAADCLVFPVEAGQ